MCREAFLSVSGTDIPSEDQGPILFLYLHHSGATSTPQTLVIPPLLGMYITILVHYRGGDFLILCRRQVLDKQKKHSRGHIISHHELNGLKFPEKVTPVLKVLEG